MSASNGERNDIGKLSNPALAKLMASILGVETTQPLPYRGFVS
jgi:hypothetical protein